MDKRGFRTKKNGKTIKRNAEIMEFLFIMTLLPLVFLNWKADIKIRDLEQRTKAIEKVFKEGFEIVVEEVNKKEREKDDERS